MVSRMMARLVTPQLSSRHPAVVVGVGAFALSGRNFASTESPANLLWRLRSMDTCALCDASEKRARVVSSVKPLKDGYHMVGRALTVHIDGDFLEVLVAIKHAEPGDVIMVDASMRGEPEDSKWPRAGGMFGELLANEAARRGVAGLVVDGNCRDTPLLLTMDLPIYSRGRHPNAGTANRRGGYQTEIQMGGVAVKPGDFVLGDDDGVVVCSESELQNWLSKAEAIQRVEVGMLQHVRGGGSLFDKISNFDAHLAAVACGRSSKLQFE